MDITEVNEVTPKALRQHEFNSIDKWKPYIPLRKSSINDNSSDDYFASKADLLLSKSGHIVAQSSSTSALDSRYSIPPLAPLAKERFPIDGIRRKAYINGSRNCAKRPPGHVAPGRRIFGQILKGLKTRTVSQASTLSTCSFSIVPSNPGFPSDSSDRTSVVRVSGRIPSTNLLESSPNPLKAPPPLINDYHDICSDSSDVKSASSLTAPYLPVPPLTTPSLSLSCDIPSMSITLSQEVWIAIEVVGFIENLQSLVMDRPPVSPGLAVNLRTGLTAGPYCTIQQVVGSLGREALAGEESWIIFVKLSVAALENKGHPTQTKHSPLRPRPSSHELMDQLQEMLTLPRPEKCNASPTVHKLLEVSLRFEHTCFPSTVEMIVCGHCSVHRVSPWGLDSRSPSRFQNDVRKWDLHSKALRLVDQQRESQLEEILPVLQDLFGEDGSLAVPQLKSIARLTMNQLRNRLQGAQPLCELEAEIVRRHGMDGSEADRSSVLSDLQSYLDEQDLPRRSYSLRNSKNDCEQFNNAEVNHWFCTQPIKSGQHRYWQTNKLSSKRCKEGNFKDSLRDITNKGSRQALQVIPACQAMQEICPRPHELYTQSNSGQGQEQYPGKLGFSPLVSARNSKTRDGLLRKPTKSEVLPVGNSSQTPPDRHRRPTSGSRSGLRLNLESPTQQLLSRHPIEKSPEITSTPMSCTLDYGTFQPSVSSSHHVVRSEVDSGYFRNDSMVSLNSMSGHPVNVTRPGQHQPRFSNGSDQASLIDHYRHLSQERLHPQKRTVGDPRLQATAQRAVASKYSSSPTASDYKGDEVIKIWDENFRLDGNEGDDEQEEDQASRIWAEVENSYLGGEISSSDESELVDDVDGNEVFGNLDLAGLGLMTRRDGAIVKGGTLASMKSRRGRRSYRSSEDEVRDEEMGRGIVGAPWL